MSYTSIFSTVVGALAEWQVKQKEIIVVLDWNKHTTNKFSPKSTFSKVLKFGKYGGFIIRFYHIFSKDLPSSKDFP